MCFYGKPECNVHPSVSHVCKHAFIKPLYYFPFFAVSAAPAERLRKHRSFSLTSHQLRALTQLAGTLLGFERTVRELLSVEIRGEAPGGKGTVYLGFDITCVNMNPSPTGIEEVELLDIP